MWFQSVICYMLLIKCITSLEDLYEEASHITQSVEEMALDYEDERNAMIAMAEKEYTSLYEDFYDEVDNRVRLEPSMNVIFFGTTQSFMRIDAESILHILVNTKKHLIPLSRAILAWDILTDGKTAAFLQGREYLAFGSLLNVVPEEDLYYVNFGDPTVLFYFANHFVNLDNRKFGVLVAAYRRYFGDRWYTNGTRINELGYLLCGFPSFELKKIRPTTFKEINSETLSKLGRCSVNQTRTLYEIATHQDAYGEPYKWSSHEIGRLDALFNFIPEHDISSIQLEAVSAISTDVMKKMDQKKLEYFNKQQILRMSPSTRRIFILRMELKYSLDMNQISKRHGEMVNPSVLVIVFNALYFIIHEI